MLRSGLIFIPILAILHHFIGLTGVQSAQAIADIMTFVITVPVVIQFIKKLD